MSEAKLISPMLDDFVMGGPYSDHHGIKCCPAMKNGTEERYIVKIISVPASPAKMDALLLSGAYTDETAALKYFKTLADEVVDEVNALNKLSESGGFLPYCACQQEVMDSGKGYDIYLLSPYKRTLQKHFKRHVFTHLDALNLGLDLCSALSACRRNGYLYVNLKPSNVFVTEQQQYRIGDLGFIGLDSLKFASLPEKYISPYTAPEISDAFSALNTTMDTYAVGLILYQVYNGGELPFNDEIRPGDTLPPPMYADYEMSEIILKACSADPEQRWQTPMEMGQAIVSYMQRNGAADTTIVPAPVEVVEEPVEEIEDIEEAPAETQVPDADDVAECEETTEDLIEDELSADDVTEEIKSDDISEDDELTNLSFLDDEDDEFYEESELSEDTAISEEVSDILEQADELANLDVPEPVVVPNHIDLPMPEPIEPEQEEAGDDTEAETDEEYDKEETGEMDYESEDEDYPDEPKKKHHWVRNLILVAVVLAMLVGGYFFYKSYYLLPIESIEVEGSEDTLTVYIDTTIDESLLQVMCIDTYGNQIPAPVIDGKAEFTGLIPNTAYNIKIIADGFHKLIGATTTAYSTPFQSNIVQFDAITGITDGSVILSFTVEGPSCDEWTVLYYAEGEEERTATFKSHMVTLTDLTVGKEYTFRLIPSKELYVTGLDEIVFTARSLVKAEKLQVVSCANNALTATWSAPEGETVESWTVRCYNDTYSQTISTTDTTATFTDLDHTAGYTIEVKASGMSVSESVIMPANSVTASNFKTDTSDPTKLSLTWETNQQIPADGWVLRYSIEGIGKEERITCNENAAVIESVIPNATYRIQLEDANGTVLLGSKIEIVTGEPVYFAHNFGSREINREDLRSAMCKTPSRPNWGRYDVADEDYKTEFPVGESAAFLIRSDKEYFNYSDSFTTMFVIRNESGTPISASSQTKPWREMWSSYNCKLEVPTMPTNPGAYTVEIYFNGGLAVQQAFTVISE